jgi:uncharacterized membrane protein YgcG
MTWRIVRGFLLSLVAVQVVAGEVVRVSRGVEIPEEWRADRTLYVKGDLGIPVDRLEGLELWLKENAPNWTVVLMRDAQGEEYRDVAGEVFYGMDAVEHAMGKRLPAETAFGEMVHPVTKEKNGAYFILYLEERKLAYHASEAYDRRRLGEDHWIGNLDAAAIAAMRGGGRVIDAARDTVTSIDRELERRVRAEIDEREREAERARRLKEETAVAIHEMRERLAGLAVRMEGLRREFGDPPGDLANPPIGAWGAALDGAERKFGQGDDGAVSDTREVMGQVDAHVRRLFEHEKVPVRIGRLEKEMDGVRFHEASVAAQRMLAGVRERLRAAGEVHARMDHGCVREISSAEEEVAEAVRLDLVTRGEVERLDGLKARMAELGHPVEARGVVERLEKELAGGGPIGAGMDDLAALLDRVVEERARVERREAQVRAAVKTAGVAGGFGLLLAGLIGNRRRRGPKRVALELFAMWEATLKRRSDGLFGLLDRTAKAVGSAHALERSGWKGETMRLARETLADVDHLFVLASGLDRVLEEARELLFPANPVGGSVNLVSGRRYERAVEMLEKRPLRFSPEDPVRRMLQGRKLDEWSDLLGKHGGEEVFTLTFPELNGVFEERAARAVGSLAVLENCWVEVETLRGELEKSLDATAALERETDAAAMGDGWFAMEPLFEKLLPAARGDRESGLALAVTDPVSALRGDLAEARRKAGDAAGLCERVMRFRGGELPGLKAAAEALTKAGRRSGWIGGAVDGLSEKAGDLAEEAVGRGISAELEVLGGEMDALCARVERAVALNGQARDVSEREMVAVGERVASERERLGKLLGISGSRVLAESEEENPDRTLEEAKRQHLAALAALDRGDVDAAGAGLDACGGWCAAAGEVMDETARAYGEAEGEFGAIPRETERVAGLVAEAEGVLEGMEKRFSPMALRRVLVEPGYPDGEASVADHVRRALDLLDEARSGVVEALAGHGAGAILKAARLRDAAVVANGGAADFLAAIHRQAESLERLVAENRSAVEGLKQQAERLAVAVSEPVTMVPTVRAFDEAGSVLDEALRAVALEGAAANPFEDAGMISRTEEGLKGVERLLGMDRALHAEAARSIEAVEREMRAGQGLVAKAKGDGIADSAETIRCVERILVLESDLGDLRRRFSEPHGDWYGLDVVADGLEAEAVRVNGELRGELERAEQCVRALHAAAERVRAAAGLLGAAGSDSLERARAVLANGEYFLAHSHAEDAMREADQAIREEEERERRRRREAEERREAERRRQRSSFSSSGLGSSRSSGFGSSRSSFSSSSGSSRSSFSSGSGTRRSGW